MTPAAARVGYWAALVALLASLGYDVAQVMQVMGVLRFPWDELPIFGFSICIPVPYLLAMLALHYWAPPERRFFSHAGVALAGMYAVICSFVYIIMLVVSLPMRIHGGNVDPMLLGMSQPRFMFSVDSLGYIFMSLSALMAYPVFDARGPQARLRWAFLAHGLVAPLLILIMVFPSLLLLGISWMLTEAAVLILLMQFFRQAAKPA